MVGNPFFVKLRFRNDEEIPTKINATFKVATNRVRWDKCRRVAKGRFGLTGLFSTYCAPPKLKM